MQLNNVLIRSSKFLIGLSSVILILALVDRIGTTNLISWKYIWISSGILVVIVGISLWLGSKISTTEASEEIDHRLE